MSDLTRLAARLASGLVVVNVVTYAIFWGFAPRWLLLDETIVGGAASMARTAALLLLAAELGVLLLFIVSIRRLSVGTGSFEPEAVLRLFSLPARVVSAHVALSFAVALATLTPFFRPETVDLRTQGALAFLFLTLVSTASLPLYGAARTAVARVLELVPADVARTAIAAVRADRTGTQRVRRRFLAAVATPVALVGIGASLLVYAHVRNADEAAREADARGFAAGILDRVGTSTQGRAAAIERGRAHGLSVEIESEGRLSSAQDDEQNLVTVPLEDGRAIVRFDPVALAPATALWGSFAFLAVVVAAFLGSRIGSGVSADVSLATQEIDAMGVSDVLRGSPVLGLARYTSVRGLTSAIDRLGGVFREFAAAQERSISARAATERMRGLLLAAMSHDLKGPLNAILGFSALASRQHLSTAQRESLTIIEQRGKELLHLVETVLDAARVEAGQLALERHEAPAADVVTAAVLDARELGTDLGRTIEVDAPESLPSLRVDSARLSQGLTALILAVARIATPGARVDVTTGVTAEALSIYVATDGGAEAKAERDELFEAFRAPGLARKHGSLGLGVALARAIIEAHGGTLEATVADDGKLRFTATLPR